jgi:hypothetical protein
MKNILDYLHNEFDDTILWKMSKIVDLHHLFSMECLNFLFDEQISHEDQSIPRSINEIKYINEIILLEWNLSVL